MTDNEIIKALECCVSNTGIDACINCPFNELKICERDYCGLEKLALDLINRQKAEIERLQNDVLDMATDFGEIKIRESEIKTEAIKEFAKRLNENCYRNSYGEGIIFDYEIDNLVQEMTEEHYETQ